MTNDDGVLMVHRERAIVRAKRPAIRILDDTRRSSTEHWLEGDHETIVQRSAGIGRVVVWYGGSLVNSSVDAVAGQLAQYGEARPSGSRVDDR